MPDAALTSLRLPPVRPLTVVPLATIRAYRRIGGATSKYGELKVHAGPIYHPAQPCEPPRIEQQGMI